MGLHAGRLKGQPAQAIYQALAEGDALFAFITPERLQVRGFRTKLAEGARRRLVNLAVVDEAHCVSEWGHDFRTSYLHLSRNLRSLCRGADGGMPPVLALTGTASPAVIRDIQRELDLDAGDESAVQRPQSYDRRNLHFTVIAGGAHDGAASLARAIKDTLAEAQPDGLGGASGLVFVPHVNGRHGLQTTREQVARLAGGAPIEIYSGSAPKDYVKVVELARQKRPPGAPPPGAAIWDHVTPKGDLLSWDQYKARSASRFMDGDAKILIATKAFGMGIDKPDIRWTLHTGIPSSIESFAQEAGRAGRDGDDAQCILIASLPEIAKALTALDPAATREARLEAYRRGGKDGLGDISRQLFFLYGSFPGEEAERLTCEQVLDDIAGAGLAPSQIRIPMSVRLSEVEHARRKAEKALARVRVKKPPAYPATDDMGRQKALYRLSLLGVVEDYTVGFGSADFEVQIASLDAASIDAALLAQAQRIEPGARLRTLRQLESAPSALPDRIRHHARLLITMIYRLIEPSRIEALRAMHALASSGLTGREISERIASYLGQGPLAAVLPALIADAETIDAARVIDRLNLLPVADDWIGAAARQLEDTPGHPVALIVAGHAEAWSPRGDPARFQQALTAGFAALTEYGVEDEGVARFLSWTLRQLRDQAGGRREAWSPMVWRALGAAHLDNREVEKIEAALLAGVLASPAHRAAILDRKLARLAGLARGILAAE
jgi:ATP-dependent DNA helicase RecQ